MGKKAIWTPQVGPQLKAYTCPVDVIMFGGSRGGGKSDALLGRQLGGVQTHGKDWNGIIFRRKYKEFSELRRRIDGMIAEGLQAERIGGDQQTNYIRFRNGGSITMAAIDRIDFVQDYVGHQFSEIGIDEATTFPFFQKMIDKLRGSLRSPAGVPGHIFCTGNPGGPGHSQVKDFFQLGRDFGVNPETVLRFPLSEGFEETRVFIPSFLKDNRVLCDNDPRYVARLMSIADPELKKAWLDGDWDVLIGQAITVIEKYHVVEPVPVPEGAPVYMSFDWGWGEPYSVNWYWVDRDGRAFMFHELYGWDGRANEGLRMSDSEVAERIIEEEETIKNLYFDGRMDVLVRYAGHDCANKWPDRMTGAQGPSTAEVFSGKGLILTTIKPDRQMKLRQLRERLRVRITEAGQLVERPMLQIYNTCRHFLRTVPALALREGFDNEIEDGQEDHSYDSTTLFCQSRPLAQKEPKPEKHWADKRIEDLKKKKRKTRQSQYAGKLKRIQARYTGRG